MFIPFVKSKVVLPAALKAIKTYGLDKFKLRNRPPYPKETILTTLKIPRWNM